MNKSKEQFMVDFLESEERGCGGWCIKDLEEQVYKEDVLQGETACFEVWLRENNYQKIGSLYYSWDEVREAEKAYKVFLATKQLALMTS